ncbi:MAG: hypothetical protein ACE5JI_11340, partial [Acidobacteriota bacterium]
ASTPIEGPAGLESRFGLSSIAPVAPPNASGSSEDDVALHILPSASIRAGEDAFLFFRVFPGEEPSRTVRLVYAIYRGNEELTAVEHTESLRLTNDPEGTPVLLQVPMSRLPRGPYRVELRLSDPRLGRRAFGEIEVSVR